MASRACGLCSLWHTGSLIEAHRLTCPTACGILVPRPGIEHVSPALEGGFFTTGHQGSPQMIIINSINFQGIWFHSLHHINTCGRCVHETCKQHKSRLKVLPLGTLEIILITTKIKIAIIYNYFLVWIHIYQLLAMWSWTQSWTSLTLLFFFSMK